jgi:hypothetical protein
MGATDVLSRKSGVIVGDDGPYLGTFPKKSFINFFGSPQAL